MSGRSSPIADTMSSTTTASAPAIVTAATASNQIAFSGQSSPLNTNVDNSPTSPRLITAALHQLPMQCRQLRPPKSPLYVPAALRPTERPFKLSMPPSSRTVHTPVDNFDETEPTAPITRQSTDDSTRSAVSKQAEDSWMKTEQLGEVTGLPTRDHWKVSFLIYLLYLSNLYFSPLHVTCCSAAEGNGNPNSKKAGQQNKKFAWSVASQGRFISYSLSKLVVSRIFWCQLEHFLALPRSSQYWRLPTFPTLTNQSHRPILLRKLAILPFAAPLLECFSVAIIAVIAVMSFAQLTRRTRSHSTRTHVSIQTVPRREPVIYAGVPINGGKRLG